MERLEAMKRGTVAILGAGAWGTALANAQALAGRRVLLWGRDAAQAADMAAHRENRRHLPGVVLAPGVAPTSDLQLALGADIVLAVVPTQAVRDLCLQIASHLRPGTPLVLCAKGIERSTGLFVTQIVAEILPDAQAAILSGPSFAVDVAAGLPTAVTLAAQDRAAASRLADALSAPALRLYHSTDVRGVEIGGAAKNVLAIACGIAAGRGLGASAGAALVARGFAELGRFGLAYGGRSETFMGLSGLGDLVLTCGSAQSRNFAHGLAIGRGEGPDPAPHGKLVEGAFTARILVDMARRAGIDMPICESVDAVLAGRIGIDRAVEALLARPLRSEA